MKLRGIKFKRGCTCWLEAATRVPGASEDRLSEADGSTG